MNNLFNSGISIEKMAAFLDGNLSASEMREITAIVDSNENLSSLCKASEHIDLEFDKWLCGWSNEDYSLPDELASMDFDIPSVDLSSDPIGGSDTGIVQDDSTTGFGENDEFQFSEEFNVIGSQEQDTNLQDDFNLDNDNSSCDFGIDEF